MNGQRNEPSPSELEKAANTSDAVSQAKASIEKAQEDLLYAYFGKIEADYNTTQPELRDEFLERVERFISSFNLNHFDGNHAETIRQQEGISREALAKKLGIYEPFIRKFENGKVSLTSFSAREGKGKAYLIWLKERGYKSRTEASS